MDICGVVGDYFDEIFRSNNPSQRDMDRIFECTQPCISTSKRDVLDVPFTVEEVRKALFHMHPSKAPDIIFLGIIFPLGSNSQDQIQRFQCLLGIFELNQVVLGIFCNKIGSKRYVSLESSSDCMCGIFM
ncbi:hypothetical protein LWI29_027586 [Acer saccharum]|uniref:Uncharacterized protein n=1 Tax=Acer saccharum TaxID=4024 RepID=A0AA39VGN1_ACESA|nr:hypothetical protein LWI29_027586 [Acer saccharum]